MNEKHVNSEPKNHPFWGHRQQVAALVAAHLGMACLTSAGSAWLGPHNQSDWSEYLKRTLIAVLYGFQIGQIVLLASWVAFADQLWLLRILRFSALTAWTLLVVFLGEYLCDGVMATLLVEEQSAYIFLLLLSPVVVLFGFRAAFRGGFTHGNAEHGMNAWQFSTRRLLLVTAELAALLALGRVVLAGKFSSAEFLAALTGFRPEEIIPAGVSVTILPVVFLALARERTWQRYFATGLCLVPSALFLAFLQQSHANYLSGPHPPGNWWPELEAASSDYLWVHASAAATILVTFWLVRRIGYDFRRRDEGPLGRSSSNARNSAASASA